MSIHVRAKARLKVLPGLAAFDSYDGFVRSLPFLGDGEVCRLIVVGDEIMDNLLTHGEIGSGGVTAYVRKRATYLTLAFFVESHRQFAAFASCMASRQMPSAHFDSEAGRWHGLGLTMCGNLATTVHYRPGEKVDRIFLTFTTARSEP